MVVGAFPIAKLAVLLVKQISKPIANVCKERAKNSPFFRTYVCMPPAQFYNWCEVKAKMWVLNLGKPVNIPVLSQEMAIELGANLLGESVIFIIGSVLLIIEYNRQSNKETAKETKRQEEMNHITSTITDLFFTVQQQQTQLRELERMIHSISDISPREPDHQPQKPTSTPPKAPPSTLTPTPTKINHIRHNADTSSSFQTPYPDKGLILRSLNYIQLDVLSSSAFSGTNNEVKQSPNAEKRKVITSHQREQALLTETLTGIEHDFRSLF